jgi:hypothetical protein
MLHGIALLIVLILSSAQFAAAQTVTTFTSRAAWEAAVGGSVVEEVTFNGFMGAGAGRTQFRTQVVDAGPFTLGSFGEVADSSTINTIRAQSADAQNDGSPFATIATDFEIFGVELVFERPVYAWGAEWFGWIHVIEGMTLEPVLESGETLSPVGVFVCCSNPYHPPPSFVTGSTFEYGFFGFVTTSDQRIAKLRIRSSRSSRADPGDYEIEDIDNVVLALTPTPVAIDIKPAQCPNLLNTGATGLLAVAVMGSDTLDVRNIDPHSVRLEGIPATRWVVSDRDRPDTCGPQVKDGDLDLVLRFDAQEVIGMLGAVEHKERRALALTGLMLDGTPIVGQDVVEVRRPRR